MKTIKRLWQHIWWRRFLQGSITGDETGLMIRNIKFRGVRMVQRKDYIEIHKAPTDDSAYAIVTIMPEDTNNDSH